MKYSHWQIVMFVAIVLMLAGAGISFWGIDHKDLTLTMVGLATVMIVCVSWWLWVMFIIRAMIQTHNDTYTRLNEIKEGISEVKTIVNKLSS